MDMEQDQELKQGEKVSFFFFKKSCMKSKDASDSFFSLWCLPFYWFKWQESLGGGLEQMASIGSFQP